VLSGESEKREDLIGLGCRRESHSAMIVADGYYSGLTRSLQFDYSFPPLAGRARLTPSLRTKDPQCLVGRDFGHRQNVAFALYYRQITKPYPNDYVSPPHSNAWESNQILNR
jgi:hypothetical protein